MFYGAIRPFSSPTMVGWPSDRRMDPEARRCPRYTRPSVTMHLGVSAMPLHDAREAALMRFDALRAGLAPELDNLLGCAAHTRIRTPGVRHVAVPREPGVYLFTEQGEHR